MRCLLCSGGSGTCSAGSGTCSGAPGTCSGASGTCAGRPGTCAGGPGTCSGASGTCAGGSGTCSGGSWICKEGEIVANSVARHLCRCLWHHAGTRLHMLCAYKGCKMMPLLVNREGWSPFCGCLWHHAGVRLQMRCGYCGSNFMAEVARLGVLTSKLRIGAVTTEAFVHAALLVSGQPRSLGNTGCAIRSTNQRMRRPSFSAVTSRHACRGRSSSTRAAWCMPGAKSRVVCGTF